MRGEENAREGSAQRVAYRGEAWAWEEWSHRTMTGGARDWFEIGTYGARNDGGCLP